MAGEDAEAKNRTRYMKTIKGSAIKITFEGDDTVIIAKRTNGKSGRTTVDVKGSKRVKIEAIERK